MLALKYDRSGKVLYEYVPVEHKPPMSRIDIERTKLVPKIVPHDQMSFAKWQTTYHDVINDIYTMFFRYVQSIESREYLISFDHANMKKEFTKWLYNSSYSRYNYFTRHYLQMHL